MVLEKYKDTISRCIRLYYPYLTKEELSPMIDYSINKRYKESPVRVENSYNKETYNTTLLVLTDYIMQREPILTSNGVMFKKHSEEPNPIAIVVQQFLDARSIHKKQMFQFPKGSEMFEKYNLYQQLDKIDTNGKHYMPSLTERLRIITL